MKKKNDQAASVVESNSPKVKRKRQRHPISDIAGTEFTWLTVIGFDGWRGETYTAAYYLCRCRCGKELAVHYGGLTGGSNKSCGCRRKQLTGARFTKHGQCKDFTATKIYSIWRAMIQRCDNPNAMHFDYYGGRGITVCEGFRSFDNFMSEFNPRPKGMSLDRENSNGNYSCGKCPECLINGWVKNVRWATQDQQSNNKRSSRFLTYGGETMTIGQWGKKAGLAWTTLFYRIEVHGWSIEKALSTPPKACGRFKPLRQFVGVPIQSVEKTP